MAKTELEGLVAKAMRGNKKALLALCHAISRSVLFRAMRRLHNVADAEDAAQEILIRVCENIQNLRNPKAFGGWLNSIIINETNRYGAKNTKHGIVFNLDDYADVVTDDDEEFLPDECITRAEDRQAVMGIVDRLPDRQQEAVMLHYYEEMSVTETAVAMGVTKQSVSRYLMLARDKIREEFQNKK